MSDGIAAARIGVGRALFSRSSSRGAPYVHAPGRTVTRADNVLFTTLTMNTQSLHLDAAWRGHQFEGASSTACSACRRWSACRSPSSRRERSWRTWASARWRSRRQYASATALYAETLITRKRLSSSRPGQGIVEFAHAMRNQRDEVVATATRMTLMRCLPAAPRRA